MHAWIVVRKGHAATEDELRSFCRTQLAPYKVPVRVEFRPSRRTMVGKVLRRALRESATRPPAATAMPAFSSAARIFAASSSAPGVSPDADGLARSPTMDRRSWLSSFTILTLRSMTVSTS